MPIPTTISDLSKVASENSPAGTESVKGTIDDYLRVAFALIRQLADLAGGPTVVLTSAATVNIGFAGSSSVSITGTTTITAFDTAPEGTMRWVSFAGALTLTHSAASLQLPGAANIVTVAGDVAVFKSLGGGNWKCMAYQRVGVRFPSSGLLLSDAAAVSIAQGGTGKSTAADAIVALGGVRLNAANSSNGTRLGSGAPGNIAAIGSGPTADNVPLIISNDGNQYASSVIQFLRGGQYAAFLGLDTDNKFKLGGYSMADAYEIYHAGSPMISAPVVTETSDERKKKAWGKLPADLIERLAGIKKSGTFRWKKGGAAAVGIGAQSLEAILPEAVYTDDDGGKAVNTGGAAMAIIPELCRELVRLRARLAKLEAK